ncbi:hypothetical protein KO525_00515 [Psychrosphaera sp. B3R10]|uniref:EF-hand domain-containing protein n=1 Tax=Psychrosphaera algicola TaxID=3023714 RepID=A0ABT5FCH7_9GAMM|nr:MULTISPECIES: hypothetical protein [unclassified Psychrosphaera]MBU2880430.1 hypothetical protein [Psychrosphaera sp. I2R16]MBU2987869.1 hypothetical protein [Psychrosphaera sp. B3R10]MDC2889240.1 hypothetical protein [Psychrosphaera sp. G1-22]
MLKLNKVTLVEIFAVFTAFAAATATASDLESAVEKDQGDLISQYDTDGDGQLSKSEASASNISELISNFDSLDANKDGQLSAEELAAL